MKVGEGPSHYVGYIPWTILPSFLHLETGRAFRLVSVAVR